MQVSSKGLNLLTSFEGLRLQPYLDSAGIATIGYGTILYPNGHAVTMNDPEITQDQATQYLEWEVNLKTASVNKLVTVSINQNQFDALVSFAYNVGLGALGSSTLLKDLNAGNISAAADEFLKWNRAGGIPVDGLTRRREAERSLFLQPMPAVVPDNLLAAAIQTALANANKNLG